MWNRSEVAQRERRLPEASFFFSIRWSCFCSTKDLLSAEIGLSQRQNWKRNLFTHIHTLASETSTLPLMPALTPTMYYCVRHLFGLKWAQNSAHINLDSFNVEVKPHRETGKLRAALLLLNKREGWGTHTSFSQSRDDVSQRRQGLVDVLGLVEQGSLCSCFTDLRDTTKCFKTNRIRNRGTQINSCVQRGQLVCSDFFVPFHCQPDPPGRVCHWASAPSECSPVWRLSGRCCDSWSCARSCLRGSKRRPWGQKRDGHYKGEVVFYGVSGSEVTVKLTCNCYVSVGFAFINRVHHFLGAADKPLSAALCRKYKTWGFFSLIKVHQISTRQWNNGQFSPSHKVLCFYLHARTGWFLTLGKGGKCWYYIWATCYNVFIWSFGADELTAISVLFWLKAECIDIYTATPFSLTVLTPKYLPSKRSRILSR